MVTVWRKCVLASTFLLAPLGGFAYYWKRRGSALFQCVGDSMEPALFDSDVLYCESHFVTSNQLHVGDIVITHRPNRQPEYYNVKRVTGLSGDVVTYKRSPSDGDEVVTVTVPKGHIWLQGDNARRSVDSRTYGPVPYRLVHSRVCLRIWPWYRRKHPSAQVEPSS